MAFLHRGGPWASLQSAKYQPGTPHMEPIDFETALANLRRYTPKPPEPNTFEQAMARIKSYSPVVAPGFVERRQEEDYQFKLENLRNQAEDERQRTGGRTGLTGTVPIESYDSATAKYARAQELEGIVRNASARFGAGGVDDLPMEGEGLQARLAAGELRKILGYREPEAQVTTQATFQSAPELAPEFAQIQRAKQAGPGAEERAKQAMAERLGARTAERTSPEAVFLKSAAGAIPEMVAYPTALGPNPDDIAAALTGRPFQREAPDPSLLTDFIGLTQEEERSHPIARTLGSLAGSAPTLGMVGPAASIGGLIESQGMKGLALRMGTRGLAVAAENAPQAVLEASLAIESGNMSIEEAATRLGTQLGMSMAGGGIIEGAGLSGRPEVGGGPDFRGRIERKIPTEEDMARLGELEGALSQTPRISLKDAQAQLRGGVPEAEVKARLQSSMEPEPVPTKPPETTLDDLLSGRKPIQPVPVAQAEPRIVGETMGDRAAPGTNLLDTAETAPPTGWTSRPSGDRQFHRFSTDDGGLASLREDANGVYLQRIKAGEAMPGWKLIDEAIDTHGRDGEIESWSLEYKNGKFGVRKDREGASASRAMQDFAQRQLDRGRVRIGDDGTVSFTKGPQGPQGRGLPPAAGGGLAAQPPAPVPKIINANLNTERIDVKQAALDEMVTNGRIYGLDITMARGQKRPHAQVEAEAHKLLGTRKGVDDLLNKPLGSAYTDVEGFALREMYSKAATKLSEAKTQDELIDGFNNLYHLEMKRTSMAAEMGRGLSMMNRISKGEISEAALNRLTRYIRASGGDPGVLANFVRQVDPKTMRTGRLDKLHEWWIQSLVSGSHAVNVASNISEAIMHIGLRRPVAAALDMFSKDPNRVRFGEIEAAARGAGILEGIKNAWNFYKTNKPQSVASGAKVDAVSALTGPFKNIEFVGTRALGAGDEMFSTIAYNGEVAALAYRKAASEGLSGAAMEKRIQDILLGVGQGTEEAIHLAALRQARNSTFTNETSLYEYARGIMGESKRKLGIWDPLRWVIPFTKVGSSIVTSTVEHSPIGFATVAIQRMKGIDTGRTLSEDLARPVVGTLLGATGYMLREQGILTGDRKPEAEERDLLLSQGWQPNSIRIGDAFVSVERFEPAGSILLFAANAVDAFNEGREKDGSEALDGMVRVARNITSDTWFNSLAQLFDVLSEKHPGKAGRYAGNFAAGFVPNIVRRGAKELGDTTRMKSGGFLDTLGQQVGLQTGEEKLDPFGRTQNEDRPILARISNFFGVPMSVVNTDPVIMEYMRLGIAIEPLGEPEDEAESFDALTPEQQRRFHQDKGKFVYELTTKALDSNRYARMPDEKKARVLDAVRRLGAESYHAAFKKNPENPKPVAKRIWLKALATKEKPVEVDYDRFLREYEQLQ